MIKLLIVGELFRPLHISTFEIVSELQLLETNLEIQEVIIKSICVGIEAVRYLGAIEVLSAALETL